MPEPPSDLPKFDQLMWPLLQALKDLGGSATVHELIAKIVDNLKLSEEAQTFRRDGVSKYELNYRSEWTRFYLRRAGAIECTGRKIWTLTPKGRSLTEEEVKRIPTEVRRSAKLSSIEEGTEAPEETEGERTWRDKLIAALRAMPPDAFERLAQRILRESGFVKVEVTGRSKDGGIDGTGVLRVGLISFQVLFQCKRYKDTVGPNVIRDFRGAMVGRSDKGLVITTGRFTPEAVQEATRDGAPPVELIDAESLCDLLRELKLGVKTEMVERVAVELHFSRVYSVTSGNSLTGRSCQFIRRRLPSRRTNLMSSLTSTSSMF